MLTTRKLNLLPGLLFATLLLAGCSANTFFTSPSSNRAPVTLTVTPGVDLDVMTSNSVQLTATYAGDPESMSWSLQGNTNALGSVTANGLYTAPAAATMPNVANVIGTSLTHPGISVTVQIAVSNPAPTVASVSPSTAAAFTPYQGTIKGSGFTPASTVLVNGQTVTANFVATDTLTFATGVVGSPNTSLAVQVFTPTPGGGPTQTLSIPVVAGGVSADAATRFLKQASWGPNPSSVAQVQQIGFSAYIDQQLALPVDPLVIDDNFLHVIEDVWMNGLYKPSQLRQKMMWSWYKLFNIPYSTKEAWGSAVPEILLRDAFGTYTQMLLDVSLNTEYGWFLTYCGGDNAGPNPNQNYARELMQLFTTGPLTLNQDGTSVLNSDGTPVPMYTQTDVSEIARAATGWGQSATVDSDVEGLTQMVMFPWQSAHDYNSKIILGHTIPAGGNAYQDLSLIVPFLVNQPNTAAFMSLRLIHSFVKSNPSPAYVARISAVWRNDGNGVTGNLAAVIKAILLDPEARAGDDPTAPPDPIAGRAMDAIEYQMEVNRILASSPEAVGFSNANACNMNECGLNPPSVFGFYTASYTLPGTTTLAPELSLFTTSSIQTKANYVYEVLLGDSTTNIRIDWSSWTPLATGDGSALVDAINHRCLNGTMSTGLRAALMQAFQEVPPDSNNSQAKRLLFLTFMSPEFAVIR